MAQYGDCFKKNLLPRFRDIRRHLGITSRQSFHLPQKQRTFSVIIRPNLSSRINFVAINDTQTIFHNWLRYSIIDKRLIICQFATQIRTSCNIILTISSSGFGTANNTFIPCYRTCKITILNGTWIITRNASRKIYPTHLTQRITICDFTKATGDTANI